MPVNKVTIAVSGALLRSIDREAKSRGMSRSEWMSYATHAILERDLLLRGLDRALLETGGPLTPAEEVEAAHKLTRHLKTKGTRARGGAGGVLAPAKAQKRLARAGERTQPRPAAKRGRIG